MQPGVSPGSGMPAPLCLRGAPVDRHPAAMRAFSWHPGRAAGQAKGDFMYYLMVTLLMLVVPAVSILLEFLAAGTALLPLIGKWFVFWAEASGSQAVLQSGLHRRNHLRDEG